MLENKNRFFAVAKLELDAIERGLSSPGNFEFAVVQDEPAGLVSNAQGQAAIRPSVLGGFHPVTVA